MLPEKIVVNTERKAPAEMPFGGIELACAPGHFRKPGLDPYMKSRVDLGAARQRSSESIVGGARVSGRRVDIGDAGRCMQLGRMFREQLALAARGGIVRLHHQDRRPPGTRFGIGRIGLQREIEIRHAQREIVAILAQHAVQRENFSRSRNRLRPGAQSGHGVADVARITLGHCHVEIAACEARSRIGIAGCSRSRGPQPPQFRGGGIARPGGQGFEDDRIVLWRIWRG